MSLRTMHLLMAGLVLVAVAACSSSGGSGGGDDTGGGGGGTGTVTGTVVDATSGSGLPNITVADLVASLSTTTASTGTFTLSNVPVGLRTLTFSGSNFSTMTRSVTVTAGGTSNMGSVAANPALSGSARRFVLSWGATPSDLDFYLVAPDGSVAWFVNQDPGDPINYTCPTFCLDYDETGGYGPETMTINSFQSGTYYMLVNDYSNGYGDPTGADTGFPSQLGASSAVVQVYTSAGLATTYTVPNCTGTNYWWNVLTLAVSGTAGPGTVTAVNTCAQNVTAITGADGTYSTLGTRSKPWAGGGK